MMITTCRILWMPDSAAFCEVAEPDELAVHAVASSPAIAAAATRRSAGLFRGMPALCSACPPISKDGPERTQSITWAFHKPASCSAVFTTSPRPLRVPRPPRGIRRFLRPTARSRFLPEPRYGLTRDLSSAGTHRNRCSPAHGETGDRWKRPRALTGTAACWERRRELGVYLVGALAPADRTTLESHLASCTSCRNQLAELAGLPGLLRRVRIDAVDNQVPAGDADGSSTMHDRILDSLLSQVARRRRYRVWSRLIPLR
jgi:Putative zinc-finger